MKKIIAIAIVVVVLVAIIAGIMIAKKNNNTDGAKLSTIRVNEVTRSVFYAPQYVAINNGFLRITL